MPTRSRKSGVTKKRGRPTAPFERAQRIHIARSAGIDEEVILRGNAAELMPKPGASSRDRRRSIRRTLDRIEKAAGLQPEPRDARPRQTYAYATKELGGKLMSISREPGWHSERTETADQMLRTARQLEARAAWWEARHDAGLVVPDLEDYRELITEKVAILRDRAERARSAERDKHAVRSFHVDSLPPAEQARYGFAV